MPDFRFEGTTHAGRLVQGVITAPRLSEARKRVEAIARKHRVSVSAINKRRTFTYRVRRPDGEQIKGEQRAFTEDEVRKALENLGYEVVSLRPKLLDLTIKPPIAELVTFTRVSADMLREQLAFNEVLELIINDTQNKALRNALKEINNDLKRGRDSEEAFVKQEKILGRFTARMLGLASKSGRMAEIYDGTARFLERKAEFRRNLRSALITPFFTVLVLIGATIYYVAYIFPETANLFVKLGTALPPMTAATLDISDFLVEYFPLISIVSLALMALTVYFLQTTQGKLLRDRYIIRLPIIGTLIHRTAIEIFCRVFHALYSSSGENVNAIRLAAEAAGNRYMEDRIKTVAIPMMLEHGSSLVRAFESTDVFTKTALARFNSGAETGTVKRSAIQVANYYEKETVYKMKNSIEFVNLLIAMFIAIVITLLTIVSSETAVIQPQLHF